MSEFFTPQKAAEYLCCSRSFLDNEKKNGNIAYSKRGKRILYTKSDLDDYNEKRTYRVHPIINLVPKVNFLLEDYDKLFLKGGSAVSKKRQRWNYGKKGVFKRKLKSGFSWCIWYYDSDGKLKKETVQEATSREDAVKKMLAKAEEVRKKRQGVRSITFREFAPIYLEKYAKPKKDSWRTDRGFIEGRLIPYFGDMLLTEISSENVSEFITRFRPKSRIIEKAKGSTVNKHLQVLSRMFSIAEEWDYEVGKNPVRRKIHFAKESKYRRTRVLSYKEEERLMQASASHLKPIIHCALLQAMRSKEILGLEIDDVDLDKGTITIRAENNKTDKLDVIPIRPKMKPIFERLIAENGGRSSRIFNYDDPRTGEYGPITNCRHAFEGALRRANIQGLEFRDLRRTCSTRLHEEGVDPLVISRLLRHSSAKISAEVYIQSSLKMMMKALDDVDKEPERKPTSNPIRTYLEHDEGSDRESKTVRCLFSMN